MKIIILSNQARSMAVFWRVLISSLNKKNMEIVCVTPPGDAKSDADLQAMGAKVIHYNLDRKGLNPVKDIGTYLELKKIFMEEKPDLLFATTIKPVIYGCLAASAAKVPRIFATITGLGYAFEADNAFKKLINIISCNLYRLSLSKATGIFFQNNEDRELFRKKKILGEKANIFMSAGTGVDINYFNTQPFPLLQSGDPIIFLLIARLLQAKGIPEYVEAARVLKKNYPQCRFQLLGPAEEGPGSISKEQLESWRKEESIEYLGATTDVRPFITNSHVAVLPSWREGTPTSIMEAMSMGRPCAVTDVPGCREVVADGLNGFLVQRENPQALAGAMEKFIKNPQLIKQMGEQSRKMAVEKFDAEKVAQTIINNMDKALAQDS